MRAIVVADGDVPPRRSLDPALLAGDEHGPPLVIAADGGARKAEALGLVPDLVVGDADSLSAAEVARWRARGVAVRVVPAVKDESDTELALREALARGARGIVVLGAFGGERFEHALANVALLALPELGGASVVLADARTTVRMVGRSDGPGNAEIEGMPGDFVSLLPVDDPVEGIVTEGLRFPLRDERLCPGPSRGLSNELAQGRAHVATGRGRLLLVQTRRPDPRDSQGGIDPR